MSDCWRRRDIGAMSPGSSTMAYQVSWMTNPLVAEIACWLASLPTRVLGGSPSFFIVDGSRWLAEANCCLAMGMATGIRIVFDGEMA